jgi:hypothetical protein
VKKLYTMRNRKNILQLHRRNKKEDFEKLRGKNRALIKEVKRLKRLKSRTLEQDDEWSSHFDDAMDGSPKGDKLQCPKCLTYETCVLELTHRKYLICQECPYRGPLK